MNGFDYLHDAPPARSRRLVFVIVMAILAVSGLALGLQRQETVREKIAARSAEPVALWLTLKRHPANAVRARRKPAPKIAGRTRPPAAAVRRMFAAASPVIDAIALGASPKALVEIDGRTMTVGLGSSLRSNVVTEIDSNGLLLSNGTRLHLRNPPKP